MTVQRAFMIVRNAVMTVRNAVMTVRKAFLTNKITFLLNRSAVYFGGWCLGSGRIPSGLNGKTEQQHGIIYSRRTFR